MDTHRWQRMKAVFHAALDLSRAERAAFVAAECAGDDAMREEILRLLAAVDIDTGPLDKPALDYAPELGLDRARRRMIGRLVGPYRIVEELGQGGMGEVYRAVRDDGQFSKAVAVKIVRGGQSSEHVLRRFLAERQILANLQHPHIAHLIDGGMTDDGVPYLVMELVEGEPIDVFCARKHLSVAACLELFRTVCGAVQYAHQRLVVHRDLKPGNILVAADGTVKLLDFGIAKLIEQTDDGSDSAPTVTAQRVLTPEYASPEQVRGDAVTTASDIYALGVVLYRLLTGQSPYGKAASPHELIRAICEADPPRPSMVMRKGTSADAARRARQVAGDVDNIVLMALRKEPDRRYASAAEFAEDIRRHLSGLPVLAHEDTLTYRLSKLIARHKLAAGLGLFALTALTVSSVVTYRQAAALRAESARAERHFADVRKLVNSFLFEVHDAVQDLPGSMDARKLLVQNALSYLGALSKEAGGDAALKRELGVAYRKVADMQGRPGHPNAGDSKGALESYTKAIKLFEELLAAPNADNETRIELAHAMTERAWVQHFESDRLAATEGARRALALAEEASRIEPANARIKTIQAEANVALAWALNASADAKGALTHLAIALRLYDEVARIAKPDRVVSYQHAGTYLSMAQFIRDQDTDAGRAAALDALGNAQRIYRKMLADNPNDIVGLNAMAGALVQEGRLAMKADPAAGVAALREALKLLDRVIGIDPGGMEVRPVQILARLQLSEALQAAGRLQPALTEAEAGLAAATRWQGASYSSRFKVLVARSHDRIAGVHIAMAQKSAPDERRRHWQQAESHYRGVLAALADLKERGQLRSRDQEVLDKAEAGLAEAKRQM